MTAEQGDSKKKTEELEIPFFPTGSQLNDSGVQVDFVIFFCNHVFKTSGVSNFLHKINDVLEF